MAPQTSSPSGQPNRLHRTLSRLLSRTSTQLSFKSVRSTFSKCSFTKRSKSINEIVVTVDQIKPHVLLAFAEDPQLFHPKDVEKINQSDSFINRFIEDHQSKTSNNWEEILTLILNSLKWRKEFGVNDLNAKMFPKEFYDLQVFSMGQVGPKEFMIYMTARRFRKIDGLQERILQFLIHCFESKCDEYGDDIKISAFADISSVGLSNVDIKLFMAGIPIFLKNYPAIAQHAFIYDMPWLMKPFAKLVLSLLPSKFGSMVTFVSKSDYKKVVPEELLPNYLGGPVNVIKFQPVDGCITIEELAKELNLTDDQLKKGKKMVNDVMKEIEKEEKRNV